MIEIQIHPSDIRRRVRYFFLGSKMVALVVALMGVLLVQVIASMGVAPTVIRRVYKSEYLRVLRQQHSVESERLREHVAQMGTLERNLDEHRVQIEKLLAVYGLDRSGAGEGGLQDHSTRGTREELLDAQNREGQLKRSLRRLQDQLDLLALYEKENADLIRHIPSILPLPADQFVLTSAFGGRISPFTRRADFHKGLDLAAPVHTPIFATADGVVTFAGRVPLGQSVPWWRFGNVVVINHADRFITIYGHCDTTGVLAGQQVKQGQVIASVGSTGWSTNSHLHYEVRSDLQAKGIYQAIDPRIYILNYQWNNEAKILSKSRETKDYDDFDPLPSAFVGRRRV
ncbi:MAG TPA: M23 family metallopeptidase [Thermoanaerobaculia bacterium]|nr:M23 family metallopeptidase [Thermoanaerobaculia bacterium]